MGQVPFFFLLQTPCKIRKEFLSMNQKRMQIFYPTTSKSGVFLLELILVILFFSIASTVCIEMFVKSYTMNSESTQLNTGIQISETLAESFKSSQTDYDLNTTVTNYYDEDGLPSTANDSFYYATIFYSSNESIRSAHIELYTSDQLIYSLTIDKHTPERWTSHEN
jgi:Tfp pilus assembly protein PilV